MLNLTNAVVVGFFSLPSPSLAEHNPSAYNIAMASAPEGAGSCAHCGTGIIHHVIVRLDDNRRVFVGSSCAEKVGNEKVQRCVRERLTAEQIDANDEARRIKVEARRRAGDELIARVAQERAVRAEQLKDIIEPLEALGTEFHSSLASQLRLGSLSPRQAEYAVKGILGRYSKRVADQWDDIYERCVAA
jgi:hypothetical protein